MRPETIRFITQTKLSALARQRDALLAQYDVLLALARDENLESLAGIYRGLKEIRVGQHLLHRDLPNIDALCRSHAAPDSLIAFWREQLLREVRRGQLRANIVYLFGAFLSEWESGDGATGPWQSEQQERQRQLVEDLLAPPEPVALEHFRALLDSYREGREAAAGKIEAKVRESLEDPPAASAYLAEIAAHSHNSGEVRGEARELLATPVLASQFFDALRIASRDPREWHWPSGGVAMRAIWTRNKWRLYPRLSLVELARLQALTGFWQEAFDDCYTDAATRLVRHARLQKLLDLRCPEVILANERRMLARCRERQMVRWCEPIDPWTNEELTADAVDKATDVGEGAAVGDLVVRRLGKQSELRSSRSLAYGYGEGANPMVQLVHAEIQLLRSAFPDRPLHLVKLDVQDYFATVPHEALLTLLEALGMPRDGLDFTRQFLQLPLQTSDRGVAPVRRGVPMEQPYSHWLCEWLLRMLEEFIHRRARVRIIRQLDDFCLLAPEAEQVVAAYRAALEFLADLGLRVNETKCGAVTIGGPPPAGLPQEYPRWGVLEVTAEGDWQPSAAALAQYLAEARREVEGSPAVLAKTLTYNEQLKFLISSLGLAMDLGDHHRTTVNRALADFEQHFFAPGVSIFSGIRQAIDQRVNHPFGEVPNAWMLWPITAGGLGLLSSTVQIGQYAIAYEQRAQDRKLPPVLPPENWQNAATEWAEFYEDCGARLEPAECSESATMKAMVGKFVQRGKAISGGKQEGLSPYWRWTLSIFGPELLEQLGTFEFLITELVPLQLIEQQRFEV